MENAIRLGSHKAILSWEFVTGLMYNLLMKPTAYLHIFTSIAAVFLAGIVVVLFLVLTPLASIVAYVKLSRFKTLIWSTSSREFPMKGYLTGKEHQCILQHSNISFS